MKLHCKGPQPQYEFNFESYGMVKGREANKLLGLTKEMDSILFEATSPV